MSRLRLAACVVLACALPALVRAQEEIFVDGNRLYQAGEYDAALEAYQRVLEAGYESAALYYNLGNAYFKSGDLARAILFYERASRLAPRDADVAANLELARSLTTDDIEPLPRFWLASLWDRWVDLVPRPYLGWLVALAWLLAGGGAVAVVLVRSDRVRALGWRASVGGTIVVVVFGTSLAVRELGIGRPVAGVVVAPEVRVRSAPSEDPNLVVFSVHEGTKVRVDRSAEGWTEVVLEDGRVGWVPTDAVEVI